MGRNRRGGQPERAGQNDILYETILTLRDLDECRKFFADLCTVSELRAMEQRFEVALLLRDGMIYNRILERTGASSATISRVNRSLQYGAGGYQTVLPRVRRRADPDEEAEQKTRLPDETADGTV